MDPKDLSRLCDCYPHETTVHLKGMTQEQAKCAALYEDQVGFQELFENYF